MTTITLESTGGTKYVKYGLDCDGVVTFKITGNTDWFTVNISNNVIEVSADKYTGSLRKDLTIIPYVNNVACNDKKIVFQQYGNREPEPCTLYEYNGSSLNRSRLDFNDSCGSELNLVLANKRKCAAPSGNDEVFTPSAVRWEIEQNGDYFSKKNDTKTGVTIVAKMNCEETQQTGTLTCKVYDGGSQPVTSFTIPLTLAIGKCPNCEEDCTEWEYVPSFPSLSPFSNCGGTKKLEPALSKLCIDDGSSESVTPIMTYDMVPNEGFYLNNIYVSADRRCEGDTSQERSTTISWTMRYEDFYSAGTMTVRQNAGTCEECDAVCNCTVLSSITEATSANNPLPAAGSNGSLVKIASFGSSIESCAGLIGTKITFATSSEVDIVEGFEISDDSLLAKILKNEGTSDRSETVEIYYENEKCTEFTVYQSGSSCDCSNSNLTITNTIDSSIPHTGKTYNLTYSKQCGTLKVEAPSWVTIYPNTDITEPTGSIDVEVEPNNGERRTGSIIFKIDDVECTNKKIAISQGAYECPEYLITPNEATGLCSGGEVKFTAKIIN